MTTLVLAYGAGLLSTVNPCGFALLPAFLAYYIGERDAGPTPTVLTRIARGFVVGLSVSAGFAGVFVIAGVLLSVGLRTLVSAIPWAAVAIGGLLAIVGIAMLAGRHVGITVAARFEQGSRGQRQAVLFGGAFALASLSCTVAVYLAVIAQALASGSAAQLIGVFIAYSAGATTILLSLTIATALARGALVRWVRRVLPLVERLAGILLLLSGAYLIAYWLPQLVHPGSLAPQSVAAIPEQISATLTAFVSGHQAVFAGLAAALLLVGIGAVAARLRRARARAVMASPGRASGYDALP